MKRNREKKKVFNDLDRGGGEATFDVKKAKMMNPGTPPSQETSQPEEVEKQEKKKKLNISGRQLGSS